MRKKTAPSFTDVNLLISRVIGGVRDGAGVLTGRRARFAVNGVFLVQFDLLILLVFIFLIIIIRRRRRHFFVIVIAHIRFLTVVLENLRIIGLLQLKLFHYYLKQFFRTAEAYTYTN